MAGEREAAVTFQATKDVLLEAVLGVLATQEGRARVITVVHLLRMEHVAERIARNEKMAQEGE